MQRVGVSKGSSGWSPLRAALVPAALAVALAGGRPVAADPAVRNGFVLEPASIAVDEILHGGPPRDGIPALENPEAVAAARASWSDDTWVLAVERNGAARAYPIPILDWHELVNDTLGGQAILVSYCPLCGTGIVFDRSVAGRVRSFGVSGLLYRSDLLMYDRESESLWSQIRAEAVTGPLLEKRLALLRSSMSRWGDWKRRHPDTTVLTRDTGHARDYDRSPYGDYARARGLVFPAPSDPRYHPKLRTLGVRASSGAARAYPATEVEQAGGRVEEIFEGKPVRVSYDAKTKQFDVDVGTGLEVVEGYWFAWSAFHPQTSVFTFRVAESAASEAGREWLDD